jgi:hypothetical protein
VALSSLTYKLRLSSYSDSLQSLPKEFCAGVDLDERLLDDFVDL